MDASMTCRPPQWSARAVENFRRSENKLSSSLWSRRHCLLQSRKPFIGPPPLKSQSRKPYSIDSLLQPISNRPSQRSYFSSPFQGSSLLGELQQQDLTLSGMVSYREAARWVCFGGGQRPRRPHIWKTKQKRGSFSRSEKLLESIETLSNVKEDVYAALDALIAWDVDFPLIPVRKALDMLEERHEWSRIIQVIKWMLGKGQGRSFNTYLLLVKAFGEEGRVDEAQEVWKEFFERHLEHTPLRFFEEIMRLYQRYEMHDEIIDVFADMEELNVNLNGYLAYIVSESYERLEMTEKAQKVRAKYGPIKYHYRTINGKVVRRPADKPFPGTEVSRWVKPKSGEEASAAIKDETCGVLNNEDYCRDNGAGHPEGRTDVGLRNEEPDEQEAVERDEHGSFIHTCLDGSCKEGWRSMNSRDSLKEAVWKGCENADGELIDYRSEDGVGVGFVTLPSRQGVPLV